ncbi:MAG: hypothetical protein ACJ790_20075 [Myxococcaceae bacterium]
MPDEKGLGSKFLGLFVENEGKEKDDAADADKSPADIVAELAQGAGAPKGQKQGPGAPGGMPAEPPLPNIKLNAAPAAAAPTDFDTIFRDAGMDVGELDRVKKAEELLKSLPETTPQPLKKQIVEASLKAFGFEVEKIVVAAQNQKRALDAYVKVNENATAKAITDSEAQIKAYNEKIAALRSDIEKRTANLGTLSKAATDRKTQVQKVLDFFQTPAGPA